ncbi:MAG: helical backbone metal receptor, partial [Myxococcota bacterium]
MSAHMRVFCLAVLMVWSALGCEQRSDRSNPQNEPPNPNALSESSGAAPSSDDTPPAGRRAQRIVSFVPALTEIAFDMGLGPRIVGVSDFATHPPDVKALTRVGGLLNPNLEQALALNPDLLLSSPSNSSVLELAKAQSIPVVLSPTNTVEDIYAAYTALGQATGMERQANAAQTALRRTLEGMATPGQARPRVLLVIGREPGSLKGLYAAGQGSFLDQLLVLAGGQNALPKTAQAWPAISKEFVLAHPPEWIVEFDTSANADPKTE